MINDIEKLCLGGPPAPAADCFRPEADSHGIYETKGEFRFTTGLVLKRFNAIAKSESEFSILFFAPEIEDPLVSASRRKNSKSSNPPLRPLCLSY